LQIGVVLSVTASVLFAVMYFYTTRLSPLTGEEIFGWRMLLTFPFATLLMWRFGDWRLAAGLFRKMRTAPQMLLVLLTTSSLLAIQIWLFMWAPLHGRALQVSLGYFLLPLTMVLSGWLFYGERPSGLEKAAIAFAAAGVGNELYHVGSLSWETMLVALGYPAYFLLRRKYGMAHLTGLWFEMGLMLPVATWFVLQRPDILATFQHRPTLLFLIPALGLISASALACYILSSRYLTLTLFGLLGYVEPVLLVCVALVLGENIAPQQWPTYMSIWAAVVMLATRGLRHALAGRS
jgi:chloramphenicol-sensitive protein RarD